MELRFVKAEDMWYSIADEEQFKYLTTRLGGDERKALEEIGERIMSRAGKEINKKEIQEVFKKHMEHSYSYNRDNPNDKLNTILKNFVDDGCLKVRVEENRPKPEVKMTRNGGMGEKQWEFYRRMMGEESYSRIVQFVEDRNIKISIPKEIASQLQITGRTTFKCERGRDSEGEYLAATPLKETAIPRVLHQRELSLTVTIPEEMLLASGLKVGDYVKWKEEEGQLSLTKTAGAGQYATKLSRWYGSEAEVAIPVELEKKLKLEAEMFGVLTFGKKKLWLEPTRKDPSIMTMLDARAERSEVNPDSSKQRFAAHLPYNAREFFKRGDITLLEVKDGKLYMRKQPNWFAQLPEQA
jgi:hypothetical protein